MDVSSISRCYKLVERVVTPNQLLLDPNNPRIVLAVDAKKEYTPEQLADDDVQDYILSVINKDEFHIAELIKGIKSSGFLSGSNDMIVKLIPNTDKFLVLEGNRRTTALKYLISGKESLNPVVLETLEKVKVKEFVYQPGKGFDEEEVIDILLGTIHITGALGWGALEKAHYIYKNYVRVLTKSQPDIEGFAYFSNYAKEVAEQFNLKENVVRTLLQVYRVYQQLKTHKYEVSTDHFTLIELAVSDRALREEYFKLNENTFFLTNQGLERLNKLCIEDNKPINNPRDFSAFSKIFKHGTEYEVKCVEDNDQPIDVILKRVKTRINDKAFFNELDDIRHKLRGLLIADFRGTQAELDLIERIKVLVDEKLYPLAKKKPKG